ncbi:type VI secretion system-associated protein TagO [Parvibaculum sp.]|uniref:type VI secretion system-associated protein TagO n=1 Tax=Parvibaculum sp. TaxID=2024848 RepID=UPI00391BC76A
MNSLRPLFLVSLFLSLVSAATAYDREIVERCASEASLVDSIYCAQRASEDYDNEDATDEGDWLRKTGVSPMDDSPTVHLHVLSEEPFEGWRKDRVGALFLRCVENKTSAYVFTGMPAEPERGRYNKASVQLRYDKEKPRRLVMTQGTDRKTLFFPDPVAEIKRMMKHDEMLFRFTPFSAGKTSARFKLTGLEKAVQPLREACHW